MKKIIALLLVLVLAVSMFAACGDSKKEEPAASETPEASAEVVEKEIVVDYTYPGGIRTGFAAITSLGSTKAADGEKNGVAQSDSTAVGVLLDNEGRIVKIAIDTAQNKIEFDSEGKLVTPVDEKFKTKGELRFDYNMVPASGIGKEWFEQVDVLEAFVIGKNIEEISGIALNENEAPTDADLAAGATMEISSFISAIEKAIINSQEAGASVEDGLGLGIVTGLPQSVAVEGDAEGNAQAYSHYAVVTVNAEGKITSALLDASQSNVKFDKEGKIVTNLEEAPQTKMEIGEGYGMRPASGIGKEWFEQAEALTAFLVGKTYDEVVGVAIVDGEVVAEDLKAGVTITLGDASEAIKKAYDQAVTTAVAGESTEAADAITEELELAADADGSAVPVTDDVELGVAGDAAEVPAA